MNIWKIATIVAGLVIVILVIVTIVDRNKLNKQYDQRERDIRAEFAKRELADKKELEASASERKRLEFSRDSLAHRISDLDRLDSISQLEEKKIPGKYKTLTSKQIEEEMLKQYKAQ